MKSIIYRSLSFLMWLVSKVYPYSLSSYLHDIRNLLYTFWIKNFIGHLGDHSYIHYPCSLPAGRQRR